MAIPDEMTALVADAAGKGALAALRVARVAVPALARGEVLVRIHAAPCNPADLMYLEGRYGIDRPLPATPGFEGAGVVVASGGGALARWLVGKRVACGGHRTSGTWAEYCVARATECMPLARDVTFEQGAAALANPTTALALVGLVARGRHRAYVQTAAAGQLGKMILVAARERGLAGIHVVRRAEQGDALRALGAMTGRLVAALPARSEVVVYGALSGEPSSGIDAMQLAFGGKRIRGFEIAGHLEELGLWRAYRLARAAQRHVRRGTFSTTIAARTPLADAPAQLAAYTARMTDGKILLVT